MPYRKSIRKQRLERKVKHYAYMRECRAKHRQVEATPSMFAMTVRVYRLGSVRQVVLHTDGLYVWHGGGKTRTYEAFCKAMNRKLWKWKQALERIRG